MPVKKYIPTKAHLNKAWKLKKQKKTIDEISFALGITRHQFEKNRSIFISYYKQKSKEEKYIEQHGRLVKKKKLNEIVDPNEGKSPNYKAGETKLHPYKIDMDVLESYVISGFTEEKIANLLGVTRTTLWKLKKEYPEIKQVMDNAKDKATAGVVKSLLVMTKDRLVDDYVIASYLGKITTKKVKKHVPGNANMVRYWLANNAGWSNEPKPDKENNKGQILRMLDKLMDVDPDKEDYGEEESNMEEEADGES